MAKCELGYGKGYRTSWMIVSTRVDLWLYVKLQRDVEQCIGGLCSRPHPVQYIYKHVSWALENKIIHFPDDKKYAGIAKALENSVNIDDDYGKREHWAKSSKVIYTVTNAKSYLWIGKKNQRFYIQNIVSCSRYCILERRKIGECLRENN